MKLSEREHPGAIGKTDGAVYPALLLLTTRTIYFGYFLQQQALTAMVTKRPAATCLSGGADLTRAGERLGPPSPPLTLTVSPSHSAADRVWSRNIPSVT